MRIFTHSIISPGLSLRQCPSRCTFRAGRNLPDKEFRYLRTVIVTAAVYWGFGSMLRDKSLTHPLNLPAPGRCQPLYFAFLASQSPMFLLNSRLGLFTAAQVPLSTPSPEVTGSFCLVPYREFSRSPSDSLRAYLCRFRVRAPGISLEGFLGSVKSGTSGLLFPPHHSLKLLDGFAYPTPSLLWRTQPSVRFPYPPALPHRSNDKAVVQEYQSTIHRLRLSASPYVTTYSKWTKLSQETLGIG